MREVMVEFLGAEAVRLGAILVQKPVYHPSGVRLHSPGDSVAPDGAALMRKLGMKSLYILEPGETEFKALSALDVEKVEARALVAGDVLAGDLRGPDGAVIASSGGILDAALLKKAAGAGARPVAIRRRGGEAAQKQARDYLALRPPAPPKGVRTDERVTEFIRTALIQVRSLLVPFARIAVGVGDDFSRAVALNTLAGAGYEVKEWQASEPALEELRSWRPHLLVIDLEAALGLCLPLRQLAELRDTAVLVCAEDGRKAEVTSVLLDGANDSVHRPPPPDMLLYKARVCMQAMGRAVNLRPAILMERRKGPRNPAKSPCALADPSLPKPMAVTSATVVDFHEGGVRIEYAPPDWPCRHAYLPHGVHPRHFLFDYAKTNPEGRALAVAFAPPRAAKQERAARVVHVELSGNSEVAGLAFLREPGAG